MSAVLDKDVLDTLTDEEREAIEAGETESEREAKQAIADDDDDDDEDGEDDSGSAPPIEGKPEAKESAAEDPERSDDVGEVGQKFRPTYKAELPADFADSIAALDTREEELARQFKDGEIEFDEYRAETRTIDRERGDLQRKQFQAEVYDGMNAQTAEQEWHWTVNRFMSATAASGSIDYAKDDAKRADLDVFIKALGSDDKNANRTYDWFLSEAHKRVQALHGLSAAPANNKPTPNRKPPLDAAPVTLAQVPGSDGPGDVAGEFADLDGLDGDALEIAIARMSPEQREKYAKGA